MNVKKFAQDKAKKIKQDKFVNQNKQNIYSVDDSKFKQFSVDLHKLSVDQESTYKRKSILKENISVFLDHQHSQNKTFPNDKGNLQIQLANFLQKIQESKLGIKDFLQQYLEIEGGTKSNQIKKLIDVLYRKCSQQKYRQHISQDQNNDQRTLRTHFTQKSLQKVQKQVISPYLEKQLDSMQKQLSALKYSKFQIEQVKNVDRNQKQYIKHTLEAVYKRQMKQVEVLGLQVKAR